MLLNSFLAEVDAKYRLGLGAQKSFLLPAAGARLISIHAAS
jgi:hypothetical protein